MAYDGSLIFDTKLDAEGFKKGMSGLTSTATSAVKTVGKLMLGAGVAIAGVGIASVKAGATFEAGMSQVASTMGITVEQINAGDKSFQMLEKAAMDMGKATMFSATEASEALNYLALAGYSAEDSVATLPKVLNLAAAGGLDLAYASDLVTDSAGALGLNISDLDGFIDQMARTSQKSNTDVGQLGEAILTVGANARGLKGGTLELNTAIGLLGNVGLKGAEAGTKLRNIIMAMTPTTKKAQEAFKQLGIDTYDANGELRGINEVFGDLNKAMDGMSTEQKKRLMGDIFNKQDMGAALVLLASTTESTEDLSWVLEELGVPVSQLGIDMDELANSVEKYGDKQDFAKFAMEEFGLTAEQAEATYELLSGAIEGSEWDNLSAQIADSEGAAQDMADTLNDNLLGKIELLKSALGFLGISIYKGMDTPLKGVVDTLTGYADKIGDTLTVNEDMKQSMIDMGLTSADLGYSIEEIPTGFEGAFSVVGEILADVVIKLAEFAPVFLELATTLIMSLINGITENLPLITEAGTTLITTLIASILEILPELIVLGIKLITGLIQGMSETLPELMGIAVEALATILDSIIKNLPIIIEAGIDIILALIDGITQMIPELLQFGLEAGLLFLEGIMKRLPDILSSGKEMLSKVVEGIINALPQLLSTGTETIGKFIEAIGRALPNILRVGIEILTTLVKGIIENLPKLIPVALQLVQDLVKAILDNLPLLIRSAIEIIQALVKGLIDNLPLILRAGLDLINGIVDGLVNNIDLLVSAGLQIVSGLVDFILNNLDMVINTALQLILAIVDGLVNNIDLLINAAVTLVVAIVEGLIRSLPQLVNAGIQLVVGIARGLLNAVPQLIAAGIQLITSLIGAIVRMIPQLISLGFQLIGELIGGVLKGISLILQAGVTIVKSFISGVKSMMTGVITIGSDLVKGIWNGISNVKEWILSKIRGFGTSIMDGIKSIFGIRSPSTKMRDEVGVMLGKGLGLGIEKSTGTVNNSARKMNKSVISIMNTLNDDVQKLINQRLRDEKKALEKHNSAVAVIRNKAKNDNRALTEEEQKQIKSLEKSHNQELHKIQEKFVEDRNRNARNNSEEMYKQAEQYINKKKEQNAVSLMDEVEYWDMVSKVVHSKSEEYQMALKKKQEAVMQINNELAKVNEEYTNKVIAVDENLIAETKRLNEEYAKAYEDRVKDLVNVAGLFSEFVEKEETDGEQLLKNLQSQVSALEDYGTIIESLGGRINNADLMGELRALGPKSVGELKSLNNMSDKELEEFVKLYEKRFNLAQKQATKELEPLKKKTEKQIKDLNRDAKTQLDILNSDWQDKIRAIVSGTVEEFDNLQDVGVNAIKGLEQGLIDGSLSLKQTVTDIAKDIIDTMKDELEIKSPSRLMRDVIGKNLTLGIGVGMKEGMSRLNRDLKGEVSKLTRGLEATVDFETKANAELITGKASRFRASETITNNNDNGVVQNITIVSPESTPSENARQIKRVGREMAFGY